MVGLMVHSQSIYFACFHCVLQYGIFFGGNSSNIGKVFTIQKKIISSIAGAQCRASYTSLF